LRRKRRYKIIETTTDYRVYVECPKMKKRKKFLGIIFEYYFDENDLHWRPIDNFGDPIHSYNYTFIFGRSTASFKTLKEAKKFVHKLKKKKLEIII
jgi:hypothetical protein